MVKFPPPVEHPPRPVSVHVPETVPSALRVPLRVRTFSACVISPVETVMLKAPILKCPRLLYQSQCEFSVDFWFQRG